MLPRDVYSASPNNPSRAQAADTAVKIMCDTENSNIMENAVCNGKDEDVAALVNFILDKVTEEVWNQIMAAADEISCILSPTDVKSHEASLHGSDFVDDKTPLDEREFGRQVHRYVQDIIIGAINIVTDGKTESELITRSDHKILLRSFADPGPDVSDFQPKFVIPTISIDMVDDESSPDTNSIDDEILDDLVHLVLTDALDDVMGDITEAEDTDHLVGDLAKHGDAEELRPCNGVLKFPAEAFSGESNGDRSPRRKHFNVKRLLGFRRRSYKLQPGRNGLMTKDIAYEPVTLRHHHYREDPNLPAQVVVKVDKPDGAVTESVCYTHVDSPARRTKAFSRRMFNRIFGNRQSYSPFMTIGRTASQEIDDDKQ